MRISDWSSDVCSSDLYSVAGGNFAQGDTGDFYGKPQDVLVPFFTSLELNAGHFQQFTCWDVPQTPGHLQNSPCVWIGLWAQLDDAEAVAGYRRFLDDYAAQQKSMGRFASTNNVRLRTLMQWLDYNHVVPADVRVQTWLAFRSEEEHTSELQSLMRISYAVFC